VSCGVVNRANASVRFVVGSKNEVLVPEGFELAGQPIHANCAGENVDVTMQVPQVFSAVVAVRCFGGRCRQVSDVSTGVSDVVCGGSSLREIRRQQANDHPTSIGEGVWGVNISREKKVASNDSIAVAGNYVFQFKGDIHDNLIVSVGTPLGDVNRPENSEFALIGAPMQLKIKKGLLKNVAMQVLVKVPSLEHVDMKSLALYREVQGGWELVGGRFVDGLLVVAEIPNVQQVVNEKNEVVLGVMGRLCVSCYAARLDRVYNGSSRDAVVLVHGLMNSPRTWQYMIDDYVVNQQPLQVWTLAYPMNQPSIKTAQQFADVLEAHASEFDKVELVGHSLGGFVIEHALKFAAERGYSFLKKVDAAIVVGGPHEGTPVVEALQGVLKYAVNSDQGVGVLNLDPAIVDELRQGLQVEKLPGVSYVAVAGNKPYEIKFGPITFSSNQLFGAGVPNDGITSVRGAQDVRVGPFFANESCKNFFLVGVTHSELNEDPVARRVIERAIGEKVSSEENTINGLNRFVRFTIRNCVDGETIAVAGKKVSVAAVEIPLLCGCGNGVCGLDENRNNCAQDCA